MLFRQIPDTRRGADDLSQAAETGAGPRAEPDPAASGEEGRRRGAKTPPPLYDRSTYHQGVPPTSAANDPNAMQSRAARIIVGAILSPFSDLDSPGPEGKA